MRTERLFTITQTYRNRIKEKENELRQREKEIEDLKGSPRYRKVAAQIEAERAQIIADNRDNFKSEIDLILQGMLDAAKKAVPVSAPSQEALRTLEALKLRDEIASDPHGSNQDNRIPASEFNAAVPIVKDNPTALGALRMLAAKHGVTLLVPKPKGLTQDQAIEAVQVLARSMGTLLHLPKIGYRKEYAEMGNGHIDDITGGHAYDAYRVDEDFKSENDFISGMAFVAPEDVEQFKSIVNQD